MMNAIRRWFAGVNEGRRLSTWAGTLTCDYGISGVNLIEIDFGLSDTVSLIPVPLERYIDLSVYCENVNNFSTLGSFAYSQI